MMKHDGSGFGHGFRSAVPLQVDHVKQVPLNSLLIDSYAVNLCSKPSK